MVQAKGVTAAAHLAFLEQKFGKEALGRILARVSAPEHRALLGRTILRSAWIPFDALMALDAAADEVLGKGDGALARTLGAYAAEHDLSTVYRIFMQVLSVEAVLTKASAMWQQYYDSGEMIVIDKAKGAATLELRGFAAPHPLLCASIVGFTEKAAALAGARQVSSSHRECRSRGGSRCLYDVRWT